MSEAPESVTFEKLGDAIEFVDKKMEELNERGQHFRQNFLELTGFPPEARNLSALDVAKLVHRLYGEPK